MGRAVLKGGVGGRGLGPQTLCTKNGPTRFPDNTFRFFPRWSLWSGGGGGGWHKASVSGGGGTLAEKRNKKKGSPLHHFTGPSSVFCRQHHSQRPLKGFTIVHSPQPLAQPQTALAVQTPPENPHLFADPCRPLHGAPHPPLCTPSSARTPPRSATHPRAHGFNVDIAWLTLKRLKCLSYFD